MFKFDVYKDKAGQWRWKLVASNGKTIAESGEGYLEKKDCLDGIASVKKHAPDAVIVES
jgi:uncharacterized protein